MQYWRRQLGGELPVLELPTKGPRPRLQTFNGASLPIDMDLGLTEKLSRMGHEQDTTLFTVVLASFMVLLYRYSGQPDQIVGIPIANRNRAEIEPLIGFFVNMLARRMELSGQLSFTELVARAREVTLGA